MRYLTTTKNLFDKNNVVDGYIDEYGTLSKNAGWKASDFIPITSNTSYTISGISYAGYLAFHAWYDINKNFISSVSNKINSQTMVSPSGAAYIRVCCKQSAGDLDTLQLEEGSTATDYVPYGYLPMYKGRYKVSNVCQLLDKSKYPATQTINGVTFTNNGDGTITANGTATDRAVLLLFYKTLPIIRGKGLIIGDPTPGYAFINYTFYDNKGKWITDNASYGGNGVIFTGKDDVAYTELYIAIEAGSTANNLVFKPQLFDLTEMYGAGNEPTTVEEFREKFPNELYPYSPYCWAKMKQMRYITTTKNLFNQVGVALIRSDGSAAPVNWYSWKGSKIYINYGLYSYGLYFQPITLSAGTYTLSAMASMHDINGSGRYVSIGYKDNSNNSHTQYVTISSDNQKISYTFTLTEETIICINLQGIGNSSNSSNLDTSFSNIQLELGDAATPYVPYSYLPLK